MFFSILMYIHMEDLLSMQNNFAVKVDLKNHQAVIKTLFRKFLQTYDLQ